MESGKKQKEIVHVSDFILFIYMNFTIFCLQYEGK